MGVLPSQVTQEVCTGTLDIGTALPYPGGALPLTTAEPGRREPAQLLSCFAPGVAMMQTAQARTGNHCCFRTRLFYRNFIRSVQRSRVVWRGEDRGGGVRFANGSTPQIALDKEQATAVYGTTGSNQHQESHHTSCRFRGLRSCLSDPIPEVSWASSLRHTPTRNTIAVALQYSRTPKSSH